MTCEASRHPESPRMAPPPGPQNPKLRHKWTSLGLPGGDVRGLQMDLRSTWYSPESICALPNHFMHSVPASTFGFPAPFALAAYPEPWVRGCDTANRPMCSPGSPGLAILVRPGVLPSIHLVGTVLTQSAPRPDPSPIALMTAAGYHLTYQLSIDPPVILPHPICLRLDRGSF